MLKIWLAYGVFLLINLGIAILNRNQRRNNLKTGNPKQINHPLWAGTYLALMIPIWIITHNYWLIGGIILQHLWFFGPLFNILIGTPPFNLSKTTTALTDRIMVKLGFKSTEKVMLLAFCVSIGLLIKSITNG